MYDKKILYQLIDNKYNDNKIDIYLNLIYHNYVNDANNYLLLISNALKYNYKKYNNIITKLSIYSYPQINNYFNDKLPNKNNIFNYFNLNNNLIDITINNHLIDDNNLKILCSSLKNNNKLKILNLYDNTITDITPLKDVLNNNTIKKIDLSYNNITDLTPLKYILKNNTNLKILNLYGNNIKDLTPLYYILNNNKIQELYIDNPYCKYIHSSNNKIALHTESDMYIPDRNLLFSVNKQQNVNNSNNYQYDLSNIFNILKNNNTLKKLDLRYFILNDLEYYGLCDMLKVNTSINSFTITNTINKSADFNHDCSELFNVLKYNNSIQELKINIYKMNKKEVKSLSEMLKYNISIKKLEIIVNNTSYNDLYLIYNSLEFNKKIEELFINNNKIPYNDIDKRYDLYLLCKCLYFNKSIKILEIYDYNITKNIDLLESLLKYNHHIKSMFLHELLYNNKNVIGIHDISFSTIYKFIKFNKILYNDY